MGGLGALFVLGQDPRDGREESGQVKGFVQERIGGDRLGLGGSVGRYGDDRDRVHKRRSQARDQIDLGRAGFSTLEDFRLRYAEGHHNFFRRIAEAAPDDFSIGFNCSTTDPTDSAYVWGQMDENFPTNPGDRHDWLELMQGIWGGEARGPPERDSQCAQRLPGPPALL